MASNLHIAAAYRKAMLDGGTSGAPNIKTDAASGKIKIYTGAQPADADAIITGTLLATIPLPASPFTGPSGTVSTDQVLTGASMPWQDTNAAATGTAAYFVMTKTDGTTVILMGSVGTSAADLVLASTSITIATTVSVSTCALTLPK